MFPNEEAEVLEGDEALLGAVEAAVAEVVVVVEVAEGGAEIAPATSIQAINLILITPNRVQPSSYTKSARTIPVFVSTLPWVNFKSSLQLRRRKPRLKAHLRTTAISSKARQNLKQASDSRKGRKINTDRICVSSSWITSAPSQKKSVDGHMRKSTKKPT